MSEARGTAKTGSLSAAPAGAPAPPRDPIAARLAWLLDDLIRVPGTRFGFGLDFLLGLVPVVGDLLAAALGLPIVVAAVRRRHPARVVVLMTANVVLDTVVGSVPLAGNLFDLFWRAHRKNLRLLENPDELAPIVREAGWKLAVVAALAFLAMVAAIAILVVLARLLVELAPPGMFPPL